MAQIEQLDAAQIGEHLDQLIDLLQDSVENGSSVGFVLPLERSVSASYWQGVISAVEQGSKVLLAAFDNGKLVGSVQLGLALLPNSLYRAEVQKLLVLSHARQRGIATALMTELERVSLALGRTLWVLDTRRGDVSEALYQKLGFTRVGVIPQYIINSDGVYDDTVVYYRHLVPAGSL